jgi:hypothetical protein
MSLCLVSFHMESQVLYSYIDSTLTPHWLDSTTTTLMSTWCRCRLDVDIDVTMFGVFSYGEPSDPSVRSSARIVRTWRAWHQYVCGDAALIRLNGQIAIRNPPTSTGRVSLLQKKIKKIKDILQLKVFIRKCVSKSSNFPSNQLWPKIISQWNTYDVLTLVDICACGLKRE